jgi:hypothetical protein
MTVTALPPRLKAAECLLFFAGWKPGAFGLLFSKTFC